MFAEVIRKLYALLLIGVISSAALGANAHMAVSISGMDFHPSTIAVAPGTTVTWTNKDAFAHTVTSDTKLWDSGLLQPGKSFSYTFDKPGRYPYHCSIHTFMTGTVTVK